MTHYCDGLDEAVGWMLAQLPRELHVAAPLGIGKPHRLLNALYAHVAQDPARPMRLYTALSLDPPRPGGGLEGRFLRPFVERHFGGDFPRLAYVEAQRRDALPAHIGVEEFYLQSGALLGSTQAQRRYASLNYTHVARALADRGVNCIVQKVAASDDGSRLSLSSNTDLTFDAIDAIVGAGLPRPLLVAEIDPHLPWLDGEAVVETGWFDLVVAPPPPYPRLFALPREPVGDTEHAIGLYASALVRDGGTLQIGIGALSDALCHALALRHTDNAAYRRVLAALDPDLPAHPAVVASGGLGPFQQGLYGCSEMINEGFRRLVEAGVLRRRVVDKSALMERMNDGSADASERELVERDGQFLHGAFYLGSQAFYDWLHGLDEATRAGIGMKRVSHVNALHGQDERLERLQRRDGRFFNTCMMATALGAAVSDGLDDGRVVSGVGGQYNFVSMAHALPGGRSVLMLRATREAGGRSGSNIRWQYGHITIPRHLRDVYVTEYGIADLRGKSDEDCVVAMTGIADAAAAPDLLDAARRGRKLDPGLQAPQAWSRNTAARVHAALAPFRADGTLPDYPLGSDFDAVEQRLLRALGWLKRRGGTRRGLAATLGAALLQAAARDDEALARMDLALPRGIGEWIQARMLRHALTRTARPPA
ncbi:acetyl-CoA hydrolase/transferase C-terminal domain-containing protein [Luteimonas composti]|uniref:Acetyl-CoA hydrolase/transferase C-terminal domain-containing protein n=1 Tax=Luteimonas composti TaxID=398257 RepID=A0ABT6MRH4_9GAMM|nr:acetyl-CoA hydrolase/transferase C-terminal domain-containing protein [Luteimonas composti]MDH7453225.1 acetyl-CoA hydrolase/transferase C-terminal domain-containing protein [Luteimonas composti]